MRVFDWREDMFKWGMIGEKTFLSGGLGGGRTFGGDKVSSVGDSELEVREAEEGEAGRGTVLHLHS